MATWRPTRNVTLTYDMRTGDLSKTSYSSIRAGILSFRRLCEQIQFGVFIYQFCRPTWRAFVEQVVLAGKLDARDYMANRDDYLAVQCHTPKWAWVDPEKDVKAEIMAIRAGPKARSMSIDETGQDEEEVDEQIARDNERADRLGLVLNSDPRKTDARGQAANIMETGDGGDAPDGDADSKPAPPKPQPPKPKRKEPKK